MTAVAVARLRIRSPPDRTARTQARVADSLRVAPAAPERLLIVRRLALGRIAADARPERWHARAADALAQQGARAVHGAHPGAADAGAVWFRSADEARALLLQELAAGRRPIAWFWRLAVRDWDGAPLPVWLPRWVATAEHDAETALALARAVVEATAAGLLPAILAAIQSDLPRLLPPPARAPPTAIPALAAPATVADAAVDIERSPAVRLAQRALLALPAAARLAVQAALAEHRQAPAVVAWLARVVVLAAAPEAVASRSAVASAADALIAQSLRAPIAATAAERRAESRTPRSEDAAASRGLPSMPEGPAPVVERQPPPPAGSPRDEPSLQGAPRVVEGLGSEAEIVESTSAYAGLLLVVRPLWRLGLPEWLERRPEALVDGFARRLLAAIGARMGADEGDAVLATLAAPPGGEWSDEITAWRVGLDRWLRRTARLKLADVVKRRGGLLLAGDRLDVRFPLAAADLRLRRHALDLDPLWTPWLGLSVRYHFRDQPLQ